MQSNVFNDLAEAKRRRTEKNTYWSLIALACALRFTFVWIKKYFTKGRAQTFGFNLLWPLFVGSSEPANVPHVKKNELKINWSFQAMMFCFPVMTFVYVTYVWSMIFSSYFFTCFSSMSFMFTFCLVCEHFDFLFRAILARVWGWGARGPSDFFHPLPNSVFPPSWGVDRRHDSLTC